MAIKTETDQSLSFRLSQAQREHIERAAQAEDRNLSSFLRLAAMDRAIRILGPIVQQRTTNQAA